ncbi:Hypothetical predicted protein [Paramuricea clavata]|uniref:Uncharacterized protein n=1 Tax=Paramuricea clavata TaxID=317549 RepID=A0A6S7J4Z0_PARCT|nr:Hypothetical predicted protein [Paramuricea clavata]
MTSEKVPISQEPDNMLIEGTRSDDASATPIPVSRDQLSSLIEDKVTETLRRTLPDILRNAFMTPEPNCSQENIAVEQPQPKRAKVVDSDTPPAFVGSSRSDKYYAPAPEATTSEELTSFIKSAFTKQLSKEVWTNVMEQYPDIKGTADFLVSPIMQTGMKEDIKRVHGLSRTKDLFTFDEGLADKQAPFISVVRPLVSALQALEPTEVDVDEVEPSGPDPDHIKALIEDAIVLLGNAHCRRNIWRQKRFAEYLTDVGKRTLKDQIPADKYLFPEQFHNVIKEEHDHANTNRKLVAQSTKPQSDLVLPDRNITTHSERIQTTTNPIGENVETTQNAADYQLPTLKDIKPTDNLVAGRIKQFYSNWTLITSTPWILSIVQGYKIPFVRQPIQWRQRQTKAKSKKDLASIKEAILQLQAKGAVKAVQEESNQFTSTLFIVKQVSKDRPIFNLKNLNRFVQSQKFKMEECRCGLGLSSLQRTHRVDSGQGDLRTYSHKVLHSTSRLVCISAQSSTTPLCFPAPRPGCNGGRCNDIAMEQMDIVHSCANCNASPHSEEIREDQATCLLIAPNWPGQTWYPLLLEMLVNIPSLLPMTETSMYLPFDREAQHPLWKTMKLAVWPLSGNVVEQEVFHRKFVTSLWPPGEKERKRDTKVLGDFGLAGVSHGINVHFQPL